MAIISAVLSDGVKRVDYDAMARTAMVYYSSGAVEYFQGVAWTDFSTVTASTAPLASVQANFVAKYKSSKGER
jgi:hypothetical protein